MNTTAPIDMILFCPACGVQHVDRDERPSDREWAAQSAGDREVQYWSNPPHRSHLCSNCGHIWRPADVATNGVKEIKTKGKADSPFVGNKALQALLDEPDTTLAEDCTAGLLHGEGASEDHQTFIQALLAAGLSEATAKEVHRRTLTHPDAPNMIQAEIASLQAKLEMLK